MMLARFWTRLARLEDQASHVFWYDDQVAQLLQGFAEAGAATGLAPAVLEDLCAALRHTFAAVGQRYPRRYTAATMQAVTEAMVSASLDTIKTLITEQSTRNRLIEEVGKALHAIVEAEKLVARP